MSVGHLWDDDLVREDQSTQSNVCPSASLTAIKSKWIVVKVNLNVHSQDPAPHCVACVMVYEVSKVCRI
jgi:hypothetical protein